MTIPPSVIEWAAADPIFGAISKEAATVEFRDQDDPSVAIPGTIVPLPPSMPFAFDLFFIEGTAGIDGEAVALGPDGQMLEGGTSLGTPREDVVRIDGSMLAHAWIARFRGDFEDDTACIYVTVDGEGNEPLCPKPVATSLAGDQPSLHVVNTADLAVVVGSVPPEVVEIRFTSDSGWDRSAGPIPTAACARSRCLHRTKEPSSTSIPTGAFSSRKGWPGPSLRVSRWLRCRWILSTAAPTGPSIRGSDPLERLRANEVVARLFDDSGIQATQGEVACDEGAADVVGPDARWRVGVYFETEDEANAFALQSGLLGHEADPVITRVTTYCLD